MIRLIYTSVQPPGFDCQAFERLCAQASQNNAQLGINGLLLSNGVEFMQCIEGPKDAVASVYKKIVVDSRHFDIRLLVCEHTQKHLFDRWSMVGVSVGSKSVLSGMSIAYTLLDHRVYRPWKSLGVGAADLIYEYANVKSELEKAGENESSEQGV